MKLMCSGSTSVAAMTRSPSFSRSSSSRMTTISPARMAATISGVEFMPAKGCVVARAAMASNPASGIPRQGYTSLAFALAEQALDIARDEVDLDVDRRAGGIAARDRHGERMRNHVDLETAALHGVDRETDAVDGHGALAGDVALERRGQLECDARRAAVGGRLDDLGHPVHVAGDEVAVERVAQGERRLEVDAHAGRETAERRDGQRRGRNVGRERLARRLDDRETHAVDGDARAER